MKNPNEEILDEFLFNRNRNLSELEKQNKKIEKGFGKYTPVSNTGLGNDAIFVTDPDEVKKRLTGSLGVVIGNNTVKSMADKSIKRFPIIASDDLSPETVVMLKSYLEEQYCNDICLLISNMIIDINQFKTNNKDGNIALQALDVVSNTEFNNRSIARKALNGTLNSDDIFKNSPMHALLRTESFEGSGLTTGNEFVDSLLSEAVIMPSSVVGDYINSATEKYYNDIINEDISANKLTEICNAITNKNNWYNNLTNKLNALAPVLIGTVAGNDTISYTDIKTIIDKIANVTNVDIDQLVPEISRAFNCHDDEDSINTEINNMANTNRNNITGVLRTIFLNIKNITDTFNTNNVNTSSNNINQNQNNDNIIFSNTKYKQFNTSSITQRNAVTLGLDNESKKIADKYLSQIFNPLRVTTTDIKRRPDHNGKYNSIDDKNNNREIELQTLADVLSLPENDIVRDRFNKALYLLGSRRISGGEFISYCTNRLGLPVNGSLRSSIDQHYQAADIHIDGINYKYDNTKYKANDTNIHSKITDAISNNEAIPFDADVYKIADNMLSVDWKKTFKYVGVGSVAGLAASSIPAVVAAPWLLAVGAAGGAVAGLIALLVKGRKKKNINISTGIVGWERVEALIDEMDRSFRSIKTKYADVVNYRNNDANNIYSLNKTKNEDAQYDKFLKNINNVYRVNITNNSLRESFDYCLEAANELLTEEEINDNSFSLKINPELFDDINEAWSDLTKNDPLVYRLDIDTLIEKYEVFKDALDTNQNISEAFGKKSKDKKKSTEIVISSKTPVSYQTFDINYKNKNLEPLLVPEFTAADTRAYGSVEYDRKIIRDRRYNEPLFITVKFKTRYADDKFKDSELTAVIGILGVVTMVPSDEMTVVLKQNAGIDTDMSVELSPEGQEKSALVNILNALGGNNMSSKLEKSGKIWDNLSKVTRLALSNKLAGKSTNELANAHILFSTRETQKVKVDGNIDYLRNIKLMQQMMKKYNASEIIVCDDLTERAHICDELDKISYEVVPYSALRSKSSSEQTTAILNNIAKQRM